jgi:hypothetical protein
MTSDEILLQDLRRFDHVRDRRQAMTRAADRIQNLLARNASIELAYKMSEEELKAARRVVDELRWSKAQLQQQIIDLERALERANRNSAVFNMKQESPAAVQGSQPAKDWEQLAADVLNDTFSQDTHPTAQEWLRAGYTLQGQPVPRQEPAACCEGCKTGTADCDVNPLKGNSQQTVMHDEYQARYNSTEGWHLGKPDPAETAKQKPECTCGSHVFGRDAWHSVNCDMHRRPIKKGGPSPYLTSRDTWFIKR